MLPPRPGSAESANTPLTRHHFVEYHCSPTPCGYCKKIAWGQKQPGLKCNACGLFIHAVCQPNLISEFCSSESLEAERLRTELEQTKKKLAELTAQPTPTPTTLPNQINNNTTTQLTSSPQLTNTSGSGGGGGGEENSKDECIVCMENKINTALLECGHRALCYDCAVELEICPICRQKIVRVIKLYDAY
eukprot:TRINITY_DN4390_c0_g2_i2.p1 TRINITY_DN4390_c0_g2~~TRINITY_DN4390_c0_g2_i2.p1  ORF type:complete len:199 (-),score=64.21 TRINITY_DN4390_c0_g2_i2:173-742(-)